MLHLVGSQLRQLLREVASRVRCVPHPIAVGHHHVSWRASIGDNADRSPWSVDDHRLISFPVKLSQPSYDRFAIIEISRFAGDRLAKQAAACGRQALDHIHGYGIVLAHGCTLSRPDLLRINLGPQTPPEVNG
jgi:hypothetical protein